MTKKSQKGQGEPVYHIIDYGTYFWVWVGLAVLTGVTIMVSGMNLGSLSIFAVLLIALIKTGLVLYFFMHLKYEGVLFQVILLFPLVTLTIFIGLTFFDISFR
jgi:cytochrome c oxidase subunit IV